MRNEKNRETLEGINSDYLAQAALLLSWINSDGPRVGALDASMVLSLLMNLRSMYYYNQHPDAPQPAGALFPSSAAHLAPPIRQTLDDSIIRRYEEDGQTADEMKHPAKDIFALVYALFGQVRIYCSDIDWLENLSTVFFDGFDPIPANLFYASEDSPRSRDAAPPAAVAGSGTYRFLTRRPGSSRETTFEISIEPRSDSPFGFIVTRIAHIKTSD